MKFLFVLSLLFGNSLLASAESPLPPNSIYQLDQHWTNQDGMQMQMKDFKGFPAVITMTYASCLGACPLIVSDMKTFDAKLSKAEKRKIKYMAFSIDPARDNPKVMKIFFEKRKLDSRWNLLTSNPDQVRELAAVLGFGYKDLGNGDFSHSSTLYLISTIGVILARKDRNSDWFQFLHEFRDEKNLAK